FLATATGPMSNWTAQAVFTDSVSSVTITSPTTASPETVTSLPHNNLKINFDYSTSTTGTTTGIATVKKGGTTIVGSSPPKNLTSGINKSGFIQVDIPAGTADGAYDVKVEITNTSGTGSGQKT